MFMSVFEPMSLQNMMLAWNRAAPVEHLTQDGLWNWDSSSGLGSLCVRFLVPQGDEQPY